LKEEGQTTNTKKTKQKKKKENDKEKPNKKFFIGSLFFLFFISGHQIEKLFYLYKTPEAGRKI